MCIFNFAYLLLVACLLKSRPGLSRPAGPLTGLCSGSLAAPTTPHPLACLSPAPVSQLNTAYCVLCYANRFIASLLIKTFIVVLLTNISICFALIIPKVIFTITAIDHMSLNKLSLQLLMPIYIVKNFCFYLRAL